MPSPRAAALAGRRQRTNRAADARLGRIEKALQTAENRLDAVVYMGKVGESPVVSDELHKTINALVGEASNLRPVSHAGFASKARIAARNRHLASVGRSVLYSLVEDLQVMGSRRG